MLHPSRDVTLRVQTKILKIILSYDIDYYCANKLTVKISSTFQKTENLCQSWTESSMIKRVLGQPNFSPQTNTTQLSPQINTNFNNLSSVKVNTNMSVVLSWTNGTSLNFL